MPCKNTWRGAEFFIPCCLCLFPCLDVVGALNLRFSVKSQKGVSNRNLHFDREQKSRWKTKFDAGLRSKRKCNVRKRKSSPTLGARLDIKCKNQC